MKLGLLEFQQTKTKDATKDPYKLHKLHTRRQNTQHTHFRTNTGLATNVHTFTGSIVDLLFEQFEAGSLEHTVTMF